MSSSVPGWATQCDEHGLIHDADEHCPRCRAAARAENVDSTGGSGGSPTSPTPTSPDSKPGANPTPERAREAIATLLRAINADVDRPIADHTADGTHPDRPTTARDYFRDDRGWSDETIDTYLCGFIRPPDYGEKPCYEFLRSRGFLHDEIHATGLFTEKNDSITHPARWVMSYLNAEGEPAFCITRAVSTVEGETHPDDYRVEDGGVGRKYLKPSGACLVAEPIFGAHTIEDSETVLITEGIADAITAHQAGYACLSPVTTHFKASDREGLLAVLKDHDVNRVVIINDSEPPMASRIECEKPERIGDVLNIDQMGRGLKGALDTAAFLAESGIDARLGELPRPGGGKVDLDDYLGYDGDLRPVIAQARPADDHPFYTEAIGDSARREAGTASGGIELPSRKQFDASGTGSPLFELDVTDVTRLSAGYRGENPLGHHGESNDYFTITKNGAGYRATDYKYGKSYTALSYLLCDAGERQASDPNGELSRRETFVAWKQAREIGVLGAGAKPPSEAFVHLAIENGLCEESDLTDGWKLPTGVFADVLTILREEYDAETSEYLYSGSENGGDGTRPDLPDGLADPDEWHWQRGSASIQHGSENTPVTIREWREGTTEAIVQTIDDGAEWVVSAMPTLGKSYGAINAAAITGEPVSIFTCRGREEQYEQYEQWAESIADKATGAGLLVAILPSAPADCETFDKQRAKRLRAKDELSDDEREWLQIHTEVWRLYENGMNGGEIHQRAKYIFDEYGRERLPCEVSGCEYKRKTDHLDRESTDVLIGHYSHAHVVKNTKDRATVFDEYGGGSFVSAFTDENRRQVVGGDARGLTGAINAFLEVHDGVPFDCYVDLIDHRDDTERRADALAWFDEHGVGREPALAQAANGHALGPVLAYSLLAMEPIETDGETNGWHRASLPTAGNEARRSAVFNRAEQELYLLRPPTLTYADAVIGLDGTPSQTLWDTAFGSSVSLSYQQVYSDGERRRYLSDVLGHEYVVLTENAKPYLSGRYVTPEKDGADFKAIADEFGREPWVISSSSALAQYRGDSEVSQHIQVPTDENGSPNLYYGNLLGSNKLANERLGVVAGSPNYGDKYVEMWGAFAGEAVTETPHYESESGQREYSGVGDEIARHVSESAVLQAALRFGRDGGGALVFFLTSCLPEWVPRTDAPGVNTASDGLEDIARVAVELADENAAAGYGGENEYTRKDVVNHDRVGVAERHVKRCLRELVDRGALARRKHRGRYLYSVEDSDRLANVGDVDLGNVNAPTAPGHSPYNNTNRGNVPVLSTGQPVLGESPESNPPAQADSAGDHDAAENVAEPEHQPIDSTTGGVSVVTIDEERLELTQLPDAQATKVENLTAADADGERHVYVVERDARATIGATTSCTCPADTYNAGACKHRQAVESALEGKSDSDGEGGENNNEPASALLLPAEKVEMWAEREGEPKWQPASECGIEHTIWEAIGD